MTERIAPPRGPARYNTPLDHAVLDFENSVVRIRGIDALTTEVVRLRCARLHDCRKCQSLRSQEAVDEGFDEELAAKIDDFEGSDLAPHHKAALRLVDAMILLPGSIGPSLREDLDRHFTRAEIAELCLDIVKWSVQKVLVALHLDAAPSDGRTTMRTLRDGQLTLDPLVTKPTPPASPGS